MEPTTDEMLMMRPHLFFVIPLDAAFVIRKTEFKFVLMTSNHASSFIRIIKVSLVMPALFTRISGAPYFSVTALTISATLAESVTSSFIPSPWRSPSKRFEMASAPESDVAVPTTTAPALAKRSAMAAPIPREAPVTMATLPVRSKPVSAPAFIDTVAAPAALLSAGRTAVRLFTATPAAKAVAATARADGAPRSGASRIVGTGFVVSLATGAADCTGPSVKASESSAIAAR
mmetsp:Transcript_56055/g.134015  ORF Transcript_56055/g.134015 Transcript_56055/m.134015 type:complete len:232 (+) Transcript_56055:415-1110(+)